MFSNWLVREISKSDIGLLCTPSQWIISHEIVGANGNADLNIRKGCSQPDTIRAHV